MKWSLLVISIVGALVIAGCVAELPTDLEVAEEPEVPEQPEVPEEPPEAPAEPEVPPEVEEVTEPYVDEGPAPEEEMPTTEAELTEEEQVEGIQVTEGGVKYLVDPKKIRSGGPPKDGIPSIDNPKFISVEEADKWIEDNELVLVIIYKDVKRAYPFQILVWHEIVNDVIAGDPILITYCPLCGSSIAYERVLDGEPVEFGVSGKLYNSDLIMYDRKTDTYWSQIDGLAILGPLTGRVLTPVSVDTVVWRDWKKGHPDSEVLSQRTGYVRPYGRDPYGNYYETTFLMFPVEGRDDRTHPKTVIFGIKVGNTYKAYLEDDLKDKGVITDTVAGVNVKLERDDVGLVKITNTDTGEEIIKERDFWFAWYAFHPDTLVYGR